MKFNTAYRSFSAGAGLPVLLLALALSLAPVGSAVGVEFKILSEQSLTPGEVLIGLNQQVVVDVHIVNEKSELSDGIQSFQLAISHDPTILDFVSATWNGTDLQSDLLNQGEGPDFFEALEQTDGGGTVEGVTIGSVFDYEDLQSFLLRAGDHKVARLTYRGIQSTDSGTTSLDFAASLGVDPVIENRYQVRAGDTRPPDTTTALSVFVGGDVAYAIHFDTDLASAKSGEQLTLPIILQNNPLPVNGFSFGVGYDGAVLSLSEVRLAEGLTAVVGSDSFPDGYPFFGVTTVQDDQGNEIGFTVAAILSINDETLVLDPIQSPHHILDAVFDVSGSTGSTTTIELTGDLKPDPAGPPVAIAMGLFGVPREIQSPSPPPPGSITFQVGDAPVGAPFKRGDVDQTGRANIFDVIHVVNFQFNPGNITNPNVQATINSCLGAFDVDGQNNVTPIDAILLLRSIFGLGGISPALPYRDCGFPEEGAEIDPEFVCAQFNCID